MGWTGTHTSEPVHELVTRDLEYGGQWKVIARSGKYYVIERQNDPEYKPQRLGVVALVNADIPQYKGASRMVYTKLVDETMGPYEYGMPDKLLDLLTDPPENEYAAEWRRKTREANAAKRAMPSLKPGDIVKLAEPITFANGAKVDTLKFEGGFKFLATATTGYQFRARLNRTWKQDYKWEKVTA